MRRITSAMLVAASILCIALFGIIASNQFVFEAKDTEAESQLSKANKGTSGYLGQVVVDLNNTAAVKDEEFQIKLDSAKEINEDVWGWIYAPEFKIDYPILWSEDNKKYLRTNINGKYDISGSIYLDANYDEEHSPVKLIHGHNMKNRTMFSQLPKMLKWDTLDNAPTIQIYDDDGLKSYKIVSVFSVNSKEESVIVNEYSTLDELQEIKQSYIERSWVAITDVPTSSEMLMLNTCWYGASGKERNLHCIVVAVRV